MDQRWCVRHHPGCEKGKAKMPRERIVPSELKPDLASDFGAYRGRCEACENEFEVDLSELLKVVKKAKGILDQDEAGTLGEGFPQPC